MKKEKYLTRTIWIRRSNKAFKQIDDVSFKSKNIYNAVLYEQKQIFFRNRNLECGEKREKFISKTEMFHIIKAKNCYKEMGHTKVAGGIYRFAHDVWSTYIKALIAYGKDKSKFDSVPQQPRYLDKDNGRSVIILNTETILKLKWNNGYIGVSVLPDLIIKHGMKKEDLGRVKQVMIVPVNGEYKLLIQYSHEYTPKKNPNKSGFFYKAGIDLGINRLASIATTSGFGYLLNGRPLKSINKRYNILIDEAKSKLPFVNGKQLKTSRKIKSLNKRRTNAINDYMHKASRKIVDLLYEKHVNHIIVGLNKGWKQDTNLGKRNNRKFTEIPFGRFIYMLEYKSEMMGIKLETTEEAYTSKASALDRDQLFKFGEKDNGTKYLGKRHKGRFTTSCGANCNADTNGAVNILRKGDTWLDRLSLKEYRSIVYGCVVHPEYINFDY